MFIHLAQCLKQELVLSKGLRLLGSAHEIPHKVTAILKPFLTTLVPSCLSYSTDDLSLIHTVAVSISVCVCMCMHAVFSQID